MDAVFERLEIPLSYQAVVTGIKVGAAVYGAAGVLTFFHAARECRDASEFRGKGPVYKTLVSAAFGSVMAAVWPLWAVFVYVSVWETGAEIPPSNGPKSGPCPAIRRAGNRHEETDGPPARQRALPAGGRRLDRDQMGPTPVGPRLLPRGHARAAPAGPAAVCPSQRMRRETLIDFFLSRGNPKQTLAPRPWLDPVGPTWTSTQTGLSPTK